MPWTTVSVSDSRKSGDGRPLRRRSSLSVLKSKKNLSFGCAHDPQCGLGTGNDGYAARTKRRKPTAETSVGADAAESVERRAGVRGIRTSKARTGLRTRLACHMRWSVYGKTGRQTPEVGAVCGKAARTVLGGGRAMKRTSLPLHVERCAVRLPASQPTPSGRAALIVFVARAEIAPQIALEAIAAVNTAAASLPSAGLRIRTAAF